MATSSDQAKIALAFGHVFRDGQLLKESLTAAGAEGEDDDGNRRLAMLGHCAISLAVARKAFKLQLSREATNKLHTSYESKASLAAAADATDIVSCMKLCERSGPPSTTVKSLAVSAVIGAAWLESECLYTVTRILDQIYPATQGSEETMPACVNPALTVVTTARDDHSSSLTNSNTNASLPFLNWELPKNFEDTFLFANIGLCNTPGDPSMLEPVSSSNSCCNTACNAPQGAESQTQLQQPRHREPGQEQKGDSTVSARLLPPKSSQRPTTSQKLYRPTQDSYNQSFCIRKAKYHRKKYKSHSSCEDVLAGGFAKKVQTLSIKNGDFLLKIFTGLCSPQSVIELRDTIQILRGGDFVSIPSPHKDLPTEHRLQVIDRTEQTITSLALLRWLHILKLWEEHRPPTAPHPGWINYDGARDLDPSKTKRPGNPLHLAESEVASSISRAIQPKSVGDAVNHDRPSSKAKKMRKLGERLNMLKERFGAGILALISCSELDSAGPPSSASRDTMLLRSTDAEFKSFLSLVNVIRGDMLRKFSAAAEPIVNCIWDGTLCQSEPFPLEKHSRTRISALEGFSETLLSCFSTAISLDGPVIGVDDPRIP